jgi:hypothetical protein
LQGVPLCSADVGVPLPQETTKSIKGITKSLHTAFYFKARVYTRLF